jgi:cytochrome c5
VLLALVGITIGIFILASVISSSGQLASPLDDPLTRQLVEERIKPIGQVNIAGRETAPKVTPQAAPQGVAAERSGKEIVAATCASCHMAGVLNAPKLGNKDDWATRAEQGMATLVDHAINGYKSMPARGGNPKLTDEEIHKAIMYMLQYAGLPIEEGPSKATASAEPQVVAQPSPAASEPTASAASKPASEPAASAASKPASKPTAPAASKAEATVDIETFLASVDMEKGQTIYTNTCSACHGMGVAGAPKLGDKAAWGPRLAKGGEMLVARATEGFKAMPPKGTCMQCSKDDLRAAVAYMVAKSR